MITIAYFTSRLNPMWEWFIDSLFLQTTPEDRENIQLIFIDRHAWDMKAPYTLNRTVTPVIDPQRKAALAEAISGRFSFLHLPPKPSVWQGPFRHTKDEWFAASNARNTAIIAALGDYFIGVDDLSVLVPGWWDQVKHAATGGYCVCGAYKKVKNLTVNSGHIDAYQDYGPGIDSRWIRGSDSGIVPAAGSWLFGCSFGVPLDLAIKVNGFDELLDGQSAEDYDFGIRVERAGGTFFYNRNMLTLESEERHHTEQTMRRESKLVLPDRLPQGYTGNPMSDHVVLFLVTRTDRVTSVGTRDLKLQRQKFLLTRSFDLTSEPECDWRDGTPLSEY